MNYARMFFASLGGFAAYFVVGGAIFATLPALKSEFLKYPDVYLSKEGQMSAMPAGMAAMFMSIVVMAALYAMIYKGGSGVVEGARFGVMIGLFAVGAFVIHNYVNLNIGIRITIFSALAYLVEWTITGIVIGLIYRPAH